MTLLDEGRDVHDEVGAHVSIKTGVHDLEGAMRLAACVNLLQPGEKTRVVAERANHGVVGMTCLPVGKYDDARTELSQNADDCDSIFERILDGAIGERESLTPTHAENVCSLFGFA